MSNDSGKTSHIEIVQNPDVIEFLKSCSFMREPTGDEIDEIISSFVSVGDFSSETLPENLITVNSSSYEAHVRANISLCTHELVWETHKFGTDFCAVPPHSSLAQSVERVTVNHDVVGSSPTGGAKNTPKIDVFGVFSYVKTKK